MPPSTSLSGPPPQVGSPNATDDSPPTPRLTFTSLPAELKAHVVHCLDRQMAYDAEQRTVYVKDLSMQNLAMVDHTMRKLCEPYLWRKLYLCHRPNAGFLRLLSRLLPQYARHVKRLFLRAEEGDNDWRKGGKKGPRPRPRWGFHNRYESERRENIFLKALELPSIESIEPEEPLYQDETRNILNIAAVRLCTGLEELDWEDEVREPEDPQYSTRLFFDVLTSTAGPSLTSLTLETLSRGPFLKLASFVEACPNIKTLVIETCHTDPHDPILPIFNRAVASLSHLTSLTLWGEHPADSSLFRCPFAGKLTTLVIYNRNGDVPLDFDSFRSFCNTSGSSLQHLQMSAVFEGSGGNEPFSLPALTRLAWRDGYGSDLRLFCTSPITRLEFLGDDFSDGAPYLLEEIKLFQATLKEVFISVRAQRDPFYTVWVTTRTPEDPDDEPEYEDDGQGISVENLEAIQEWGEKAGVQVIVEERKERDKEAVPEDELSESDDEPSSESGSWRSDVLGSDWDDSLPGM